MTNNHCRPRALSCAIVLSLFALSLSMSFFALPAHAQQKKVKKSKQPPYALIAGTVWGPDSKPIYGVTVRIRRAQDKKPKWELHSDHHGEFAQRVPAGKVDYIVYADLKGVKSLDGKPLHLVSEVTVQINNDERQDIGLHLTN